MVQCVTLPSERRGNHTQLARDRLVSRSSSSASLAPWLYGSSSQSNSWLVRRSQRTAASSVHCVPATPVHVLVWWGHAHEASFHPVPFALASVDQGRNLLVRLEFVLSLRALFSRVVAPLYTILSGDWRKPSRSNQVRLQALHQLH
jgi:hypothetical protein